MCIRDSRRLVPRVQAQRGVADRGDAVAKVVEVARDVGLADDVVAHPEEGARRVEAVPGDELAERVVQRLERRAEMPRDEDGRLADVLRARLPQPLAQAEAVGLRRLGNVSDGLESILHHNQG